MSCCLQRLEWSLGAEHSGVIEAIAVVSQNVEDALENTYQEEGICEVSISKHDISDPTSSSSSPVPDLSYDKGDVNAHKLVSRVGNQI